MSEEIQPPAPKCPKHRIFMQFFSGVWPRRFYYCPECHDHWRECGEDRDGQTRLMTAFLASS